MSIYGVFDFYSLKNIIFSDIEIFYLYLFIFLGFGFKVPI